MSNQPACILAIDQGTTSSRAIAFSPGAEIIGQTQQEFPQIFPHNGWVEHDPEAIWSTTLETARSTIKKAESLGYRVAVIGITNQRETTVAWDKQTGKPIHNAIVWQDRRTAEHCDQLKSDNVESMVREKTGLLLDPYFSASKLSWLLDNVDNARLLANQGRLAFGTVDSFLIWRLTGGKTHATDATNASRTSLFDISKQQWDADLLKLFNIPESVLPEVRDCTAEYGLTDTDLFGQAIPILGVAGDQQAAAIGQCCFEPGSIKSTYGTGCFILMNTGDQPLMSQHRLITTVAYRYGGQVCYALEGSIFIAGAGIQWLRDQLGIIADAKETQALATSIKDNGGVYFVPSLSGLGAPYWEPEARGAIYGLTRASGKAELVRAALEAVCYQTYDLLNAMAHDGCHPGALRVDGGMVANDWLLQFLSDILELPVERPRIMETTALGAAYLAGLKAGFYDSSTGLSRQWRRQRRFEPTMDQATREPLISGWHQAIRRTL